MCASEKNPLRCPGCDRPYRLGHEKCMWCGVELPDEGALELEPDCPACGARMERQSDGEIQLFSCAECGGVWLSLPALKRFERLYEQVSPIQPVGQAPQRTGGTEGLGEFVQQKQYRRCPICSAEMARRRYQRVAHFVIDECMAHGMWFDPGEFEMAVAFLSQGGMKRSQAAEGRFKPSLGGFADVQATIESFMRMRY